MLTLSGVISLLCYLASTLLIIIVAPSVWRAPSLSELDDKSLTAILIIAGLLVTALLMEALRERLSPKPVDQRETPTHPQRDLTRASLLILIPTLFSWISFELYANPVYVFPMFNILGGVFIGRAIGRWLGVKILGISLTTFCVATIGLPIAIISISSPIQHFRRHGSTVYLVLPEDDLKPIDHELMPVKPPAPPIPDRRLLGRGTAQLLDALANTKRVKAVMINGQAHMRDESGQLKPVESGDPEALLESVQAEDEREYQEDLEAHRVAYAAWEEEVKRLYRSGRFFGFK